MVHHYSRRTAEQMVRKVRNGYEAHRLSGVPETVGAHFWKWGRMLEQHGEQAIVDLFHREFYAEDPATYRYELTYDPVTL